MDMAIAELNRLGDVVPRFWAALARVRAPIALRAVDGRPSPPYTGVA
jgi:hypothetical protein